MSGFFTRCLHCAGVTSSAGAENFRVKNMCIYIYIYISNIMQRFSSYYMCVYIYIPIVNVSYFFQIVLLRIFHFNRLRRLNFGEKPERKNLLGNPRSKWKDGITIDLKMNGAKT